MKTRLILVAAVLAVWFWLPTSTWANEIDLFDGDGTAQAYIDTSSDFQIYLWSGAPVAYLDRRNVYGFNGEHLGFFSNGVIYDHQGYAVCAVREALAALPQLPSLKSLKSLTPLKSLKELAPLQPLFRTQFSRTPCAVHLSFGR